MSSTRENLAPRTGVFSTKAAIFSVFFLHSFGGGGIFTRIPDIQQSLGLNKADLGLILMGQPIGALTIIFFSSLLIHKFGTTRAIGTALPMIALSPLMFSLAPNPALAFVSHFLYGASFALCNVSMNVEADRIEAASGARIMNRCHGLWSFGFLCSSLIGVGARGISIPPALHLGLVVPVILAICALAVWPMRASPPRSYSGSRKRRTFALPTLTIVLLVAFGVAGIITDSGTRNWSVIFMRDSFSASDWIDSLSLPAFLAMLTLGRLFADGWVERFGVVRVATTLLSIALVGTMSVVLSNSVLLAIIGFGLMGFGICAAYPLTISAAARVGDREAAVNVAAVSLTMSIIMLAVPPLMGFVAEGYGIRAAFFMLVPIFALSLSQVRFVASFAEKEVD